VLTGRLLAPPPLATDLGRVEKRDSSGITLRIVTGAALGYYLALHFHSGMS
jgi:hypothetical protein